MCFTGTMKGLILLHEQGKSSVDLVGNSCHNLLIVQILSLLFPFVWNICVMMKCRTPWTNGKNSKYFIINLIYQENSVRYMKPQDSCFDVIRSYQLCILWSSSMGIRTCDHSMQIRNYTTELLVHIAYKRNQIKLIPLAIVSVLL